MRTICVVALAVGVGLLIWRHQDGNRQPLRARGGQVTNQGVQVANPAKKAEPTQASAAPATSVATALRRAAARSAVFGRADLENLRRHIASLPTDAASREIRAALDTHADAATGLGFKLSSNGTLTQAPTLRTFLLDQLAQLDPKAAAAYAERILSSPDSADEWAVAMRSYALARTDPESRVFLQRKFREMIAQDSWRSAPAVGFLESFDVAVHLGGTELLPDLTALIRDKNNQAVAHAAFLALDRLTINEPATTLAELQRQPDAMAGREATRANFFARANVGDPEQRTLIENYLLDPKLNAVELQTFAGVFPNANYMVSPNLLTRVVTPDHVALAIRDRLSLDAVNQWLADPRFVNVKPQLQKVQQRLDMFVRQATAQTGQ